MNWYRPSCIYRAFIIPLVMRIIGISDTLSLSLETRVIVQEALRNDNFDAAAFVRQSEAYLRVLRPADRI